MKRAPMAILRMCALPAKKRAATAFTRHPLSHFPVMRFLPALLAALLLAAPAQALEKWIYLARNLQVDKSVGEIEEIMRRGQAAGYTHILFVDSKLARLGTLGDILPRYTKNTERVKALASQYGFEMVPALFHVGYSNNMLWHDPNLIEAMPVKGAPLVVRGGVARLENPDAPTLPGGDFSDAKKWSWHDKEVVTFADGAARMADFGGKNARLVQKLKVQPWRQYHVAVRVKTQDLKGRPEIKAIPAKGGGTLNWDYLKTKPTQDWTTQHAVFNSQENTEVNLYFGVWGGGSGSVWWDDASIEEVAFLQLARRDGAPLSVTTADGKALAEGRDFEPLRDPLLGTKPWAGEFDVYHEPPLLKTKLPDGTRLLASYYHGVTVYEGQAMACPSEPKTLELLRDEARRIHKLWGAKGYMMSHDEIRVLNWCAACQKRHLTPGQILAENVRQCVAILRETNPGGNIHVWSDMFDPHHNAVKGPYYLVNGTLEGSWEGLEKEVIVMPWHFSKRAESLRFFADRGHRQVIAGYYDARPERIADWIAAGKGLPGVLGVMYTTWENKYGDLEAFARAADAATK
jgi:hypothetical protein